MKNNDQNLLPAYVFVNLAEYKKTIIGRKYLIQYGVQRIIEECASKGYSVKITTIDHSGFSIVRKSAGKPCEYPTTNTYVLEII